MEGIADQILSLVGQAITKDVIAALQDVQSDNRQIVRLIERYQQELKDQLNKIEAKMALDVSDLETGLAGLVTAIVGEKQEVVSAMGVLTTQVTELQAIVAAGFQPTAADLARLTALGVSIGAATTDVSNIVTTPVVVPPVVAEVIDEVVEEPTNPLEPADVEAAVISEDQVIPIPPIAVEPVLTPLPGQPTVDG